jgi:biopolymer transport protein ExbD
MAFSSGSDSGSPMSEINVTPLVDVMLVLLIIFMITTPLMQHKVKVALPEANLDNRKDVAAAVPPITLTVLEDGKLYWNDEPISQDQMESRLAVVAQATPQPQLNVRGDKTTKMKLIQQVSKTAQQAGMLESGFIATRDRSSGN